jgi:hypothetical protein
LPQPQRQFLIAQTFCHLKTGAGVIIASPATRESALPGPRHSGVGRLPSRLAHDLPTLFPLLAGSDQMDCA